MIIEVAAGLVFRDGKLLIARRRPDVHLGNLWEFPGGKREAGETFEQCLRRELAEELGIEAEVEKIVETITHEYPERTVELRFFLCRWIRHEAQAIECAEAVWINREEIGQYTFPAADARLLEKLERHWPEWATAT